MNLSCLGPSLKLRRDINRAVAFTTIYNHLEPFRQSQLQRWGYVSN